MAILLIILLLLMVFGALPRYSSNWGYGPSGILGIVLIIVLVLLLMGRF